MANTTELEEIKIPFIERLKLLFPANRVAAIGGIVTSIVTALVTLQANFPAGSPGHEIIAKAVIVLGAILAILGIVVKFLEGSQRWDELQVLVEDTAEVYEDVVEDWNRYPEVEDNVIDPETEPEVKLGLTDRVKRRG